MTALRRSLVREQGAFELLLTHIRMPMMVRSRSPPRLSRRHRPADDRVCGPTRARLGPELADPRCGHQAVHAGDHPAPQTAKLRQAAARSIILEQPLDIVELELRARDLTE